MWNSCHHKSLDFTFRIATNRIYSYILGMSIDTALPLALVIAISVVILGPAIIWFVGLVKWALEDSAVRSQPPADVSLAVAVVGRNEEATIGRCLESILKQEEVCLQQVIFTDDQSEDSTLRVALEFATQDNRLLVRQQSDTLLKTGASPKKTALSFAFTELQTDFIAVTDADCIVPVAWLAGLTSYADSETGSVIGPSWPLADTGLKARFYRWERLLANVTMASACGWGFPASACGHSLLYRRKALIEVEAPVRRDLPSGDDDLTVQAIARKGWKVRFSGAPESVVREAGVRGSLFAQAARHQSVTRFYPVRWRILYAWSAAAGMLSFPLLFAAAIDLSYIALSGTVILKVIIESAVGYWFAKKLRLGIGLPETIAGVAFLPAWTAWRLSAHTFSRKQEWRGRRFSTRSDSTLEPIRT